MAAIKSQEISRVDWDVEKSEHLNTIGVNVNFYSHYVKQCGSSSVC